MKILLVGPYPPPHGGVSVHVAGLARQLARAGVEHRVLDTSRRRNWGRFTASLSCFALDGWTIHFHANGHNWKDWSIALVCALMGRVGTGSILTLHSGLTPDYLAAAPTKMRTITRLACALNRRVICVSAPIRDALVSVGVNPSSIDVAEACFGIEKMPAQVLGATLSGFIRNHRPLLSTALFFRPEYGFDTLVSALSLLRRRFPRLGCVVMASNEGRDLAEKRLRETGLEKNVLLSGDVEHDMCLTIMSLSDAFVRATLRDGDSISVREALALGVPVVASRTAFRPRGTILFDPGDPDAMAAGIETALRESRAHPAQYREPDSFGTQTADRLMEIYREASCSQALTPEGA